jgi:methyl-accepting chemotaxis protein
MASQHDIRDRLDFAQIDGGTRAVLNDFLPTLQRELPSILEAFYIHLRGFSGLASLFNGGTAMDRARRAQAEHWLKLFSAKFDNDYVESVRRIGLTHSRIGLEPRWYIAGYSFVLSRLYAVACCEFRNRLNPAAAQEKTGALMAALNKAVMIDMDLAISIYLDENKAAYDKKLTGLAADFEAKIGPLVASLTKQAVELNESSMTMSAAAEEATSQAGAVSDIASGTSGNVQTVASATEQLHSSVQEISRQVVQSTEVTQAAVRAADDANGTMSALSEAAQNIGDVVRLINDIASQTNLLALNATIEAARAGEAGRGFAVVASEVKSLASETAKATDSIATQISTVQSATHNAVDQIQEIVDTIRNISGIATAIATAVEQQSSATQEIARNVQDVAQGTEAVSANIGGVNQAAADTARVAQVVQLSARNLQGQANDLQHDVSTFLQGLRAA